MQDEVAAALAAGGAGLERVRQALEAGQTSSRALVEACLARIADPEGEGARTFMVVYEQTARDAADAADRLRRAGRAPGPYCGIPVSIKDLFDVAGEVTRAGSRVLADAPPAAAHAPIVSRLLAAGFVLIGRTTMTEFAFSGVGINPHYGTPRAPWQREAGHIPGGSSSGAAVSVSDGFAFGAIGTDTGGSCRIPAALCGVTGYKPTASRVPLAGALPLSPSLDSIGPLARTVSCCETLDAVLSGSAPALLPAPDLQGLRLKLPLNFGFDQMDAATEAAFDRAVGLLERGGARIERCSIAAIEQMRVASSAYGGFAAAEAFAWHETVLARQSAAYDPRVASRIQPGGAMTAAAYIRLRAARASAIASFAADMQSHDALLLPTVPIAPPRIAEFAPEDSYWRLNYLLLRNPSAFNFLDGCAISLPCHQRGGVPAGLMLAAPGLQDARLFAVASSVEAALASG